MRRPEARYTEHLPVLTALVQYLALTSRESMGSDQLAGRLSLEPSQVASTLHAFPDLFRSAPDKASGHPLYTLHARYARRGQAAVAPELNADLLKMLMDFVTGRAEAESASENARRARKYSGWAAIAASGAVGVSFLGLILKYF